MKKTLLIIGGIVAVLAFYLIGQYNSMVTAAAQVDNKQSAVEVDLQRRFDLIDNLVESVKGVMKQEQTIFLALADARSKYLGAQSGSEEKIEAATAYQDAISKFLLVVENYPELKSNENVTQLMDSIEGTENRIAISRKDYNDEATKYNVMIARFPSNIIAGIFNFQKKALFEAVDGAETAPKVDLTIE